MLKNSSLATEKTLQAISKIDHSAPRQVHLSKISVKQGSIGKFLAKRDNSYGIKKMHPRLLNNDFIDQFGHSSFETKKMISLGHIEAKTLEPSKESEDL